MNKSQNVKSIESVCLAFISAVCLISYVFSSYVFADNRVGNQEVVSRESKQPDLSVQNVDLNTLLAKGQEYVNTTQMALGKNLMQEINNKGTVAALNFCSENAIPLTKNSVSNDTVKIKRVSDRNRNPVNSANAQEQKYIEQAKRLLEQGKAVSPDIFTHDGVAVGYYPIITNQMCLQCHGTPDQELKLDTHNRISQLYPNDKAIGYKSGELRGIWVVEFTE